MTSRSNASRGRASFPSESSCGSSTTKGSSSLATESSGRLQCRGPWVVKRYFKAEQDATDEDQWFDTGDVAVIHPDGTMQITDRAKDVIKSGGEWISSIELENAAVAHPGVAEAAAIGIPHPLWDERPLLCVVRANGSDVSSDDIISHLRKHVASWWLPNAIEFVDELPHTATGKLSKLRLREQFRDYRFATPRDDRKGSGHCRSRPRLSGVEIRRSIA